MNTHHSGLPEVTCMPTLPPLSRLYPQQAKNTPACSNTAIEKPRAMQYNTTPRCKCDIISTATATGRIGAMIRKLNYCGYFATDYDMAMTQTLINPKGNMCEIRTAGTNNELQKVRLAGTTTHQLKARIHQSVPADRKKEPPFREPYHPLKPLRTFSSNSLASSRAFLQILKLSPKGITEA